MEESVLTELGLNKTDVKRVMDYAGSLGRLPDLTMADLTGLRGFGEKKARSLLDALDAPFTEQQ
jgi:ERCC4-type nuclease